MDPSLSFAIALGLIGLNFGFIFGYLLKGRQPEVQRDAVRDGSPRMEDLESLRLLVQESVDHMDHLYDRLRKRRMAEEPPKEPGGTQTPPINGKAALRAKAIALGLLPGVKAVERTHT